MGLFNNKNPNESAYAGGKKHIIDVIKNEGHGSLLVWRHPYEDFNNNSTLIVMPGEQAIFVDGGNIAEVFQEGTYKLSTNNYPFIDRLRNYFSAGISVFNCVVYYFRTATTRSLFWGTKSPIKVRDPIFHIMCDMTARGSYRVSIDDPSKFLKKFNGNLRFKSQEDLDNYFGSEIIMHINSTLSKTVIESGEELLTINSKQDVIAAGISVKLNDIISDYGLKINSFAFEAINIVDNENRRMLEDAIGKRGVMDILGNNWEAQKNYELLDKVADNPAGFPGTMAGFGVGFATGGVFNNMMGSMMNGQNNINTQQRTDNPLDKLGNNNGFNPMVGGAQAGQQQMQQNPQMMGNPYQQMPQQNQGVQPPVQSAQPEQDPLEAMKKLKMLFENDLISQEEFDSKRQEILARM